MNCKTCRFWNWEGYDDTTRGISDYQECDCRRHAPIITGDLGGTAFPKTKGKDWCGDFELLKEFPPKP